jgi:hypothetical protein
MPDMGAIFAQGNETIRWIGLGAGAFASLTAAGWLAWRMFRREVPPEEQERLRREMIHAKGKIGDGEILDVDGSVIMYTYTVAGVGYTVAQDASAIESLLPEDRMLMVGLASVRYDPKNPPNSIVVGEQWSGLRIRSAVAQNENVKW